MSSFSTPPPPPDYYDRPFVRPPYQRPPRRYPLWAYLWPLLLLLVVVGGLLLVFGWFRHNSGLQPNAQPRPVDARGDLSLEEQANIEIYERTAPSLAHIMNLAEQRDEFNLNVQRVPQGTGSGFVWDEDGHIVTAYHVVKGAAAVKVMLADHSTYDAEQIWAYPDKDMAVIFIAAPKSKLHKVLVGTSHDLKVGQVTFALGDPFGLDQTMTKGIVSALGREIESATDHPIRGVIQTSAAINPGNSGGPLFDSAGRLIGMNTAILSPSGTFAGIGFAIPVDDINRVVPQLVSHGKVVHPRLNGVQLANDQQAQQLGVTQGAVILRVLPNTPAAAAGLRGVTRDARGRFHLGDVIVAINGQEVKNADDVYEILNQQQPGDKVTLTIVRDGQRQDVSLTLEAPSVS